MQNQDTGILELDILKEIGNIGAGNATTALSQLINARIDMNIPKVAVLPFNELAEIIGGAETLVAGILLSLEGDVDGMMLFVLRTTSAHMLVNQLMGCGQPPSPETGGFNEIEESALKEIGNIITGSYLSSISSLTNMLIISSVPYLAVDMAGAILSVPAIEFGKVGDEALLIESQFKDMDVDISGYFILIPTMESYKRMLQSLGI